MSVLYLASTSPRRRWMLRTLGVRHRLLKPSHDEAMPRHHRHPERLAVHHALAKAQSVADQVPCGWVVGVDTIVVSGTRIFGKPQGRRQAAETLHLLSGRAHRVISGIAIVHQPGGRVLTATETTTITFRQLSRREINRYVRTPEAYDKAGAYGIQQRGGLFVRSVRGCYLNVVGMPLPLLMRLLRRAGWQD